jgi:hypothetical protein
MVPGRRLVYYFDAPHACSAPEEEAMSSFAAHAAAAVPGGPAAADAPTGPIRDVRPSVEPGRAGLEQRPALLDGGQRTRAVWSAGQVRNPAGWGMLLPGE